jgi:hypothetical protein
MSDSLMEKQLGFFTERKDISIDDVFKEKRLESCSNCKYIHSVKFSNNLFFCTKRSSNSRYGKKIKKSLQACEHFDSAGDNEIPRIDGYYGQKLRPVKR